MENNHKSRITPLLKRASMKAFIAAIFVMGIIRFVLTVSGLPDTVVKYFSMTVIWVAGAVYFALATETHKERLTAAYLLTFPYMLIEVAALGYTWASGHQTIFHAREYSFGTSIAVHTLGHLVGGLTWEPLLFFLFMEIVWKISRLFWK
jgi:hypothetical protein